MRLRQKMLETKTGYISVPTITAEQIVEIK
jgi:hypothetical protein